jgi:IS30 family transposase
VENYSRIVLDIWQTVGRIHGYMNSSRSLNRRQVEQELAARKTDLTTFIKYGLAQGKSMEEIWMDLRQTTGVPFSVRTLYRWVDALEKAAS